MTLSIKNIAGTLGLPAPAVGCNISHLLTDSRSLESAEDSLFFAIPTKGNDGHRFISDLYSHGVRNFVVNRVRVSSPTASTPISSLFPTRSRPCSASPRVAQISAATSLP